MVTIKIETDNAAFEEAFGDEVARILRDLARRFESQTCIDGTAIRDINGNKVGTVKVS